MWNDSLPSVFSNGMEFCNQIVFDFPSTDTDADIHMKLMNCSRMTNESHEDFYYRVLAIGHRGLMQDNSINQYILKGLNDYGMQQSLASNLYVTSNDLLVAIRRHLGNAPLRVQQRVDKNIKGENARIRCYNCNEEGHVSINCKQPKKRLQCKNCQKVGHTEANCRFVKEPVKKIDKNKISPISGIIKEVQINGMFLTAFIDPGSSMSLIRKSYATIFRGEIPYTGRALQGMFGGGYECTTQLNITLRIDAIEFSVSLLIIEDKFMNEPILVGNDVLYNQWYDLL
ncbi:uncharacterized protein LOC119668037 [Teleopsis dalmanni]|uniref:uncharacterized protein LOC119668037 n=1 Tax=Teleopsis dalmanni TaxID=139649 RepID=UPI0018CFDC8C|nr:uncharacterized protein LOC119668037 [Teleopsis dalmanni]